MGHRSCIVRHCPTTLPEALTSRTHVHRCLGHGNKKRASSRSLRSPTTYVIILESRRSGGSIVYLLLFLPCSIVRLFQPILIPRRFDELYDRVRESIVGPIDRSSWSTWTTAASCIFVTRSGKSINEFVESSRARDQACAIGIRNEYRTCKSISEFQVRSRVLERPGGPATRQSPPMSNAPSDRY